MRRKKKKLGNRVFLATALDGSPLEFLLGDLREIHFLTIGRTGQRKTLELLSRITQFMAFGDGVVFIDLGGDRAAFHILKDAAHAAGKKLHLCSIDNRHDSLWFDPLVTGTGMSDPVLATNVLGSGVSLVHSEGFGRTYFSRTNLSEIAQGFDRLSAKDVPVVTTELLIAELEQIDKLKGRGRHPSEAVLAIDQLNRVGHFGLAADPKKQLNLRVAIQNGDVVYFWLPAALYGGAARAIATLASWCVMVEMAQLDDEREENEDNNSPPPYTHLCIDEFAQVAAGRSALESQLVLCRRWFLQMHLVIQDPEQLNTPDGDLYPTLSSNCQQMIFRVYSTVVFLITVKHVTNRRKPSSFSDVLFWSVCR